MIRGFLSWGNGGHCKVVLPLSICCCMGLGAVSAEDGSGVAVDVLWVMGVAGVRSWTV